MLSESEQSAPVWLQAHSRRLTWVILGLTLLLVLGVRFRLRDMPLERDEGEYAYAGQLMLQGVPPYKEAYNMKLPGTYAAYALIMAVFGQSPAGIHIGLALVNAATVFLVYLLGRRLLDEVAGVTAAVAYALLSLSPAVLGLAAHATHFVVLPALGGILCLLSGVQSRRPGMLFAGGILFGLAFLMKQHGIFFGLFGASVLLWSRLGERLAMLVEQRRAGRYGGHSRRRPSTSRSSRGDEALTQLAFESSLSREAGSAATAKTGWLALAKELSVFAGGFLLPYLFTCLVLWWAGVFPQFWFWTVTYAGQYASAMPWIRGQEFMRVTASAVISPSVVFWLLLCAGAILMWWEERLDNARRFFFVALLVCSMASVAVGFYFREHYFIPLLPVVALLGGVAVSRSLHLVRRDRSVELFLALAILILFPVALATAFMSYGSLWFATPPKQAVDTIYVSSVFSDARKAGDYLRAHAAPDARIAVLGSEPEIFFYARRRAATGYIYAYPLMERHPYALKMQEDVMRDLERVKPEYVVYVNNPYSWLPQPGCERKIMEWWPGYWATNLDLIETINTSQGEEELAAAQGGGARPGSPNYLLLLKRKTEARGRRAEDGSRRSDL